MDQQPMAIWNGVRGVWEKPRMVNLFCEHLELFSETWPVSGMMRDGQVFGLQMREHLTTGLGFSLSPIPDETLLRNELLPTPNTMDMLPARDPSKIDRSKDGYANVRETVVNELLPTPIASEGTKQDVTVTVQERIDTGHQVHLTHIARSGVDDVTVWGRFEPAIRRWEAVLGRPAPAPTKPDGKDGAHRLSSEFTEWMMGLPAGWVTGCGLSRNEELKACGNGVVPQQAVLALRMLLDGIDPERERERDR